MRELKHHEKKLLKKVDFVQWKHERNVREIQVLRRYAMERADYTTYSRLVGLITKLARRLSSLPADNKFRVRVTDEVLEKLYSMGLIDSTKSLVKLERVTVSALARRRLPVVMVRLKMADNLTLATKLVQDGHVRIGPEVVTNPAIILSRPMEDLLKWVDASRIKRAIQTYAGKKDDYQLLGEG